MVVSSIVMLVFLGGTYIFNPCDDKAWQDWSSSPMRPAATWKEIAAICKLTPALKMAEALPLVQQDRRYLRTVNDFFHKCYFITKFHCSRKAIRTAWIFSGQQDMDDIATANEKREGCDGNYVDINDMNQL